MPIRLTLAHALRLASSQELPSGWLYLPSSDPPRVDTPCLLVCDDDMPDDPDDSPSGFIDPDFPVEGLDTQTIEDTTRWVQEFGQLPSDELLVESFVYYWRFDAFLPAPGAPDPSD